MGVARRGAARDGATSRSMKAFQFGDIDNAKKENHPVKA